MFADVGKVYVVAQPGTSNGERITFQRPRELRHARGFSFGQQDHPRKVWREGGEPSREPNSSPFQLTDSIWAPVAASQMRADWSSDADITWALSGEKTTEMTLSVCPLRTAIPPPVLASQTRAVLSQDAVTSHAPSGE